MQPRSTPRRRHDAEFKAKVLAACSEPGASIAAVALAHGLNANLVRKWRMGRGLRRAAIAVPADAPSSASAASMAVPPLLAVDARFLPIEMSKPADSSNTAPTGRADAAAQGEATIHIELRRGPASLVVRWPASAPAGDCTAWLRDVAAGLLK